MERPIYDYSSETASRTRTFAGQAGGMAQQMARDQLQLWGKRLGEVIRENPGPSLGAALGMGVLLGWLIKRR